MLWKTVEAKFGKKLADKMSKSKYLIGITITIDPKTGEDDIPKSDIYLAYRDVKGLPINPIGWD